MSVLETAKELIAKSEYEECTSILEPFVEANPDDLEAIHLLAECYAENGEPEMAYRGFLQLAESDPEGSQDGFEKFLWLGQLSSGREAVTWYERGIDLIRRELTYGEKSTEQLNFLRTKMCQGLCGQIEIWMTDLCMEPEAESNCEKLIVEALMTDDAQPESWSMLGSIRISQQRDDDAREALKRAWDLFSDPSIYEYSSLSIPPLIRLAQSMLELDQYSLVLDVTTALNNLDDQVIDIYYLNGLAHFELYKQALAENNGVDNRLGNRHAVGAQEAWTTLIQLAQQEEDDYSEMVTSVEQNLKSLPEVGPGDYSDSESEEEIDEDVLQELEK